MYNESAMTFAQAIKESKRPYGLSKSTLEELFMSFEKSFNISKDKEWRALIIDQLGKKASNVIKLSIEESLYVDGNNYITLPKTKQTKENLIKAFDGNKPISKKNMNKANISNDFIHEYFIQMSQEKLCTKKASVMAALACQYDHKKKCKYPVVSDIKEALRIFGPIIFSYEYATEARIKEIQCFPVSEEIQRILINFLYIVRLYDVSYEDVFINKDSKAYVKIEDDEETQLQLATLTGINYSQISIPHQFYWYYLHYKYGWKIDESMGMYTYWRAPKKMALQK